MLMIYFTKDNAYDIFHKNNKILDSLNGHAPPKSLSKKEKKIKKKLWLSNEIIVEINRKRNLIISNLNPHKSSDMYGIL